MVQIGQPVTYVDPTGIDRPALVTAVFSPQCVNVVIVNSDEAQQDSYGRKIERVTSVIHASTQGRAHGNYWKE